MWTWSVSCSTASTNAKRITTATTVTTINLRRSPSSGQEIYVVLDCQISLRRILYPADGNRHAFAAIHHFECHPPPVHGQCRARLRSIGCEVQTAETEHD